MKRTLNEWADFTNRITMKTKSKSGWTMYVIVVGINEYGIDHMEIPKELVEPKEKDEDGHMYTPSNFEEFLRENPNTIAQLDEYVKQHNRPILTPFQHTKH